MIKTLLRMMAIALAAGSIPAGAVDPASNPGALSPTVAAQAGLLASADLSRPNSIANFSIPVATGPYSLPTSGAATAQQGGVNLVSVAAVPEPSGGAMLLCGVLILGFIAQRKSSQLTD